MLFFDFYVYYAASVVIRRGGDPYDHAVFSSAMREIGWPAGRAISPFAYGPWSLWVFAPLASVPYGVALAAWCALQMLAVVVALALALAVVRRSHPEALTPPQVALAAVAFVPLGKMVLAGQITWIPLAATLLAAASLARGRRFIAGALLSLAAIKPQLLAPALAACAVDAVLRRGLGLVSGLVAGISVQVAVGSALHPDGVHAISRYLDRTVGLATLPGVAHSSLAAVLANVVPGRWAAVALPAVGIALGVALAIRRSIGAEPFLFALVPLSLVTAPYLWPHDLALLLPLWLSIVAATYRRWGERTTNVVLAAQAAVWTVFLAMGREDLFAAFTPLYAGAHLVWSRPSRSVSAGTDARTPWESSGWR
jgi:alpha-1,2-mannosyltransferase